MPSRAKKVDHAVAKLPSIPKDLVAQLLTGLMTGEAINAAGIAFKQDKRAVSGVWRAQADRFIYARVGPPSIAPEGGCHRR